MSGFALNDVVIYSYKSSSNLGSAIALAEFIKDIAPETKVIIHRDKDFMVEDEVDRVRQKICSCHAVPFITAGSDIESYYLRPFHIAAILDEDAEVISAWMGELAQGSHNKLVHSFTRKRDEIKWSLYKNTEKSPPDTQELIGDDIPLPEHKRLGKTMLKLLRGSMKERFGREVNPLAGSVNLRCEELVEILKNTGQ